MSIKNTLPALTLIFTVKPTVGGKGARGELLDLADVAIDAIEQADERFSILKAFTFYAGEPYEEQHQTIKRLEARIAELERD